MNKKEDLLIIFVRNPELGKVKTRLAATIGPVKALAVYKQLLARTQDITQNLPCTKVVYYDGYLPEKDSWSAAIYQKKMQQGPDLGQRMLHAFTAGFAAGYRRICIMGSDCYELTSGIIQDAFRALAQQAVVVGPATDGGYYLLGMQALYPELFYKISWSTPEVLAQTVQVAQEKNLTLALLPPLTDVDEEKDLVTITGGVY